MVKLSKGRDNEKYLSLLLGTHKKGSNKGSSWFDLDFAVSRRTLLKTFLRPAF